MDKKYIFITTDYNGLAEGMFADLIGRPDTVFIKPYQKSCSGVLNFILKVKRRIKFADLLTAPFNSKFSRLYTLDNILKKYQNNDVYVIFSDMTLNFFPYSYIRSLIYHNKAKCFVLFLNSMKVLNNKTLNAKLDLFKACNIFTFDGHDAKLNEWNFVNSFYSAPIINYHIPEKKGVYYIGQAGNRFDIILNVLQHLNKNNIYCNFNVAGCSKEQQVQEKGLNYIKGIPYMTTIEQMNSLDCILEIQSKGQSGPTLRYFQAVSMNKKLLTNNSNVTKLDFYNPEYIKIFSKPEDIDVDWLQSSINIDYKYDNRYSPENFINLLK